MIKQRFDSRGFVDFQSMLYLLILFALIGGIFWYVFNRQQPELSATGKPVAKAAKLSKGSEEELPQRYHDDLGNFSIGYPASWQIKTSRTGADEKAISTTTLSAPGDKTKVYLAFQKTFVPANCIPDYYDHPFLTTNRCFSGEYLRADPLPTVTNQQGSADPDQWFVAHYHFKTITINARELYESCVLTPQPQINKPQMGLLPDHPVSQVRNASGELLGYFSACVEAGSAASDLSGSDAITGETILRSLRFE